MNIKQLTLLTVYVSAALISSAQQSGDTLLRDFQEPPSSARPRVWWHWMNGNITEDGIRKDLLWMKRSGIAGFQNFDAAMETPQIVKDRLVYMTPGWKKAFGLATRLADSLQLETAIAGSPGWSESGGSWVPVEDGMKKIVWTETRVHGGKSGVILPQAPASQGTFQNLPLPHFLSNNEDSLPSLYQDIAVIAYHLPVGERSIRELSPVIQSSGGNFSVEKLTDGDLTNESVLPANVQAGLAWIQYAFQEPVSIRALTILGGGDKGFLNGNGDLQTTRWLEVSEDGEHFQFVCYLPAGEVLQQTFSFPAVTAKYFRVTIKNLPGNREEAHPGTPIAEFVLHTGARVHHFEDKAGFAPSPQGIHHVTPAGVGAALTDVIDVTAHMRTDGTLDWTLPAGNWILLRFGYTVMGHTNHPATKEATGFEVDKMDPAAIEKYFTTYLDKYQQATGGKLGQKGGIGFMVNDSWEPGAQNWSAKMPAEFASRRGYSLLPWLPTLAGYIVESPEASDRFLYDFRRTIGEMTAEYHYDGLTDILAHYGMKRYTESHETRRAMIADGMDVKRRSAVPMSGIWTKHPYMNKNDQTSYEADIRESASVAHIYGQNLVAAESFTALGYGGYAWSYCPENLKPTADLALASGLNRFVVHCSPHQPLDSVFPGLGLGPFGQWFNRHETWAAQAKVWTDYLARSSYLLQQGKFVADILWYYGEDDNITSLYYKKLPVVPRGYNYDFINTHALLNLVSVRDGKLVTPSGMSYEVLVLDSNARRMPLAVLRKIGELVKAGAKVAGVRPEHSTGLKDDEAEFQQLVEEIFGSSDLRLQMTVSKDVDYTSSLDRSEILFVHRTMEGKDIYWINSRNDTAQMVDITFRVSGKVPEIWDAVNGSVRPVSYIINSDGTTTIKLLVPAYEALFVVFDKKASKPSMMVKVPEMKVVDSITGTWSVAFQKDRGAPASAKFDQLISFTEHADAGIKYFSGTATYRNTFQVASAAKSLLLDLGKVKNIAEVFVNGKSCGTLWRAPFVVDISEAVKAGKNTLEVRVTNLWVNRLIGDEQPGVTKKITWASTQFYDKDSPLLQSGLMGPVRIMSVIK